MKLTLSIEVASVGTEVVVFLRKLNCNLLKTALICLKLRFMLGIKFYSESNYI